MMNEGVSTLMRSSYIESSSGRNNRCDKSLKLTAEVALTMELVAVVTIAGAAVAKGPAGAEDVDQGLDLVAGKQGGAKEGAEEEVAEDGSVYIDQLSCCPKCRNRQYTHRK